MADEEQGSMFFFNDTATTEIYTLSLHDALPICSRSISMSAWMLGPRLAICRGSRRTARANSSSVSSRISPWNSRRSEEHTSELQSRQYLVCRLLLEKKNIHHSHPHASFVCLPVA